MSLVRLSVYFFDGNALHETIEEETANSILVAYSQISDGDEDTKVIVNGLTGHSFGFNLRGVDRIHIDRIRWDPKDSALIERLSQ